MSEKEQGELEEAHSEKTLWVPAFVAFALLVVALLATAYFAYDWSIKQMRKVEVVHLLDEVNYYDEVLTMSARLAVFRPEPHWLERYEETEQSLDKVLAQLETFDLGRMDGASLDDTAMANTQLVALEKEAIKLVGEGREAEAEALLFSPEYHSYKALYQAGQVNVASQIFTSLKKDVQLATRLLWASLVGVTISLLLFTLTVRRVRSRLHLNEQRLLERNADLQEARRKEQVAARVKSDFIALVAHELRTPLTPLMLLSEMAFQQNKDPNLKDNLSGIYGACNRLNRLINDVLDFSRIERGKLDLVYDQVLLAEWLAESVQQFRSHAALKGLEFRMDVEAQEGSKVIMDAHRMQQVVGNLLSNAVKFTEKGFVELRLVHNPTQEHLKIEVEDSGIGMSKEETQSVFDAFEQGTPQISRDYGGTGLGLSIANGLVSGMGGTLRVQSEKGKGTVFTLEVPVRAATEKSLSSVREREESLPVLEQAKVFIVEDERASREAMSLILKEASQQVRTAYSAEEALAQLAQLADADIVLVDNGLPGMSGLSLAKRLRELLGAKCPVLVACTADPRLNPEEIDELPFDYILAKPFTRNKLFEVIQNALKSGGRAS